MENSFVQLLISQCKTHNGHLDSILANIRSPSISTRRKHFWGQGIGARSLVKIKT